MKEEKYRSRAKKKLICVTFPNGKVFFRKIPVAGMSHKVNRLIMV